MNSQVEVSELTERIRHEAARHGNIAYPPPADQDPTGAPGASMLPPAPVFIPAEPAGFSCESLLAQARNMVERARGKTTVRKSTPKLLRPLYRNQGGYNDIVLETLERLREANRLLMTENFRLRMHVERQTDWMQAVERGFARIEKRFAGMERQNGFDQTWLHNLQASAEALNARFTDVDRTRLEALETRVNDALEKQEDEQTAYPLYFQTHAEEVAAHLQRLQTQSDEQHAHTQHVHGHLDELGKHVNVLGGHLHEISERTNDDRERLDGLGKHANALSGQVHEVSERTNDARERLDGLGKHANALSGQVHEIGEQTNDARAHTDRLGEHLKNLQAQTDHQSAYARTVHGHLDELGKHVSAVENRFAEMGRRADEDRDHTDRLGDHLKNLQGQDNHQDVQIRALDSRITELCSETVEIENTEQAVRDLSTRYQRLETAVSRLDGRQSVDSGLLKNQLWLLQRTAHQLPTDGQPAPGGDHREAVAVPAVSTADLDALYVAFEDVFRGSRGDIKERLEIYLPMLRDAHVGAADRPLLDLGCGRGEWLELLGEHHIAASGVDLNVCMIDECLRRELPAVLGNAVNHLAALPAGSIGAVTAFHLIEHLPFDVLVLFFRECRRVLKPGGLAIFETPNPNNIIVGAGQFYDDHTHQRPLPPNSTRFLVEQAGFGHAEILPLHPRTVADKVHGDGTNEALVERFNELFYGPQDYAIIASVPA